MRVFRLFALLGLMSALGTSAYAQQGYQYTSTSTTDGEVMTSEMYVWGSHIKTVTSVNEQVMASVSFDGNVMILSDGTQYFELTRAQAEQMAAMVAGASGMMAQAMEQARQNMSEEELEELKKMGIPGLTLDEPGPTRESRRVGSSGKDSTPLGPCTIYRYELEDGTPDQELCISDDEIPGFEESKEAFEGLADFFESFRSAMANSPISNMSENPFDRMDELEGLPLKGKQYVGGQLVSEWMMTDARAVDLSASDFGPPEGLPKAEMPIGF